MTISRVKFPWAMATILQDLYLFRRPILLSSGPPFTCHVPDLFSRASEFLHNYCVRWALGGSHGVAPA